jgi:hypothetical protein
MVVNGYFLVIDIQCGSIQCCNLKLSLKYNQHHTYITWVFLLLTNNPLDLLITHKHVVNK